MKDDPDFLKQITGFIDTSASEKNRQNEDKYSNRKMEDSTSEMFRSKGNISKCIKSEMGDIPYSKKKHYEQISEMDSKPMTQHSDYEKNKKYEQFVKEINKKSDMAERGRTGYKSTNNIDKTNMEDSGLNRQSTNNPSIVKDNSQIQLPMDMFNKKGYESRLQTGKSDLPEEDNEPSYLEQYKLQKQREQDETQNEPKPKDEIYLPFDTSRSNMNKVEPDLI